MLYLTLINYFYTMVRLLKYIIIFIAGYKLVKIIWAQFNPQEEQINPAPKQQNFQHPQNTSTNNPTTSKFNDAELIDYEEVQ